VTLSTLQYLTERHCSSQWRDVLGAFASELADTLDVESLRELMRRVGARFAARFDLGQCDTIADLERALTQVWLRTDWGWTQIEDNGETLTIHHHCAPLRTALGESADAWSPGFLEGAYQHWFRALGSSEALALTQVTQIDATGTVAFRFGR